MRFKQHVQLEQANSSDVNASNIYSLCPPARYTVMLRLLQSGRPIGALFLRLLLSCISHFPVILQLFSSQIHLFSLLQFFSISTTTFLRPNWDFCSYFLLSIHIYSHGCPCTLGCNPIFHASWAVAGWVTYGTFPAYVAAVVVGV
jgi:hypothetical protein